MTTAVQITLIICVTIVALAVIATWKGGDDDGGKGD